jgi:hypothetical protein
LDAYASEVLKDGPIAYYRLDDAVGSATAADFMGNYPAASSSFGVSFGQAGLFAGSLASVALDGTGFLDVRNAFGFSGKQPFTIEGWAQRASDDRDQHYFAASIRTDTMQISYGLFHLMASLGFERSDGLGWDGAYSPDTFAVYTAAHIAAVFDGTSVSLFQDGMMVGEQLNALIDIPSTPIVFRWGGAPGGLSMFSGKLDDLAIYDHALSPARIVAHYKAAVP